MPRYRVTLGIRRHAVRRLAGAGARGFGAGPAHRGDRQVLGRDGLAARGRPHGRRRACAGPGRAFRPCARVAGRHRARGGELPPQARPDRHPRLRRRRRRFRRALQRRCAPLPLPHPGAPGAARARPRPGLVGAAAAATRRRCRKAADRLVGRHDFTTFRAAGCQAKSPLKTLDRLEVRPAGEEIRIEASARSFLHNQVRSMVGSLKLVGEGKWRPHDLGAALRRGTARPAARSLPRAASIWCGSTTLRRRGAYSQRQP